MNSLPARFHLLEARHIFTASVALREDPTLLPRHCRWLLDTAANTLRHKVNQLQRLIASKGSYGNPIHNQHQMEISTQSFIDDLRATERKYSTAKRNIDLQGHRSEGLESVCCESLPEILHAYHSNLMRWIQSWRSTVLSAQQHGNNAPYLLAERITFMLDRELYDMNALYLASSGLSRAAEGIRRGGGKWDMEAFRHGCEPFVCPTNVHKEIEYAVESVSALFIEKFGVAPEVEISCDEDELTVLMSPEDLYFMITEVLKNGMKATIDRYGTMNVDEAPPIEVKIFSRHRTAHIHVLDRGVGLVDVRKAMGYFQTSVEKRENPDFRYSREFGAPLAGLGLGLPRTRIQAQVYGGDFELVSLPWKNEQGQRGHGSPYSREEDGFTLSSLRINKYGVRESL